MDRGDSDALVARARQGDEEAWAQLYADHAERLVVWLSHLNQKDPAWDAEDIAAEAWLTAARRLADFAGDRHDFAGWLFGIARNVSRSRYRRTRVQDAMQIDPTRHDATTVIDDHAVGVASADLTRWLVAQLPEREAQVVACIDVVGLDVATTSRALDMSATAVRVAHHRGLRRLGGLLERVDSRALDVTLGARERM